MLQMKYGISKLRRLAFVLLVMAGTAVLAVLPAEAENLASVNGSFITDADLAFSMALFKQKIARQNRRIPPEQLAMVREQMLDNMINQELMYQESLRQNVPVDEGRIGKQIADIKAKFSSQAAFDNAMNEMGISENILRKQMRKGSAVDQWAKQVFLAKTRVSETEARSYYDQHTEQFSEPERVKASHILIKIEPSADKAKREEARRKLAEIRDELTGGGDFAALARKYSEGPSGPNGGELGYFERGQMVKPFEEAAFQMKPGEISGIIETRFGYHLIKVLDKTPAKKYPFEQKKKQITSQLKREKAGRAVKAHIASLRQNAKIEIY
jgi:peptidyl-prolyl cis-trans isomerase C